MKLIGERKGKIENVFERKILPTKCDLTAGV
jgi:hypothetical protein